MEPKKTNFQNKTRCLIHKIQFNLTVFALLFLVILSKAQNFPTGFSQVQISPIYYPTSIAFAPDGRIFCTEKAGKVKIIKNGSILGTPFLQVSVDQQGEHGLVGIGIDPDFASNQYVYVYYTTAGSIHGRLSRFTANGDVAAPGSEVILLESEPLLNTIHCGGGIAFGPDGKLYLGIGNDNISANSQTLQNLKGKVLRINKDGTAPGDNPFSGSYSASRIWAYGLRNPWTIAIGSGKIFVNEVGESSWEEINDCTNPGKNFGWPATEGYHNNPAYANPVYAYPHGAGISAGCSITGGSFFNSSSSNYPSQYQGKYFFIDYCNMWINYLDLSSGVVKQNFASNLPSSCNYIKTGKDGNLYYFSIGQNSLYKIIYSGGGNNTAPAITSDPVSQTVSQGQLVSFQVSASGTQPLSYQWQKNNQNIQGANAASYVISSVTGGDAGSYKAIVSNPYGSATSNAAVLTVTGEPNSKPVATVLTPVAGSIYRGDDVISFSGKGTDNEDGDLPNTAFNWIIDFHHDQHTHPGPFIPAGVTSGTFHISPDGEKSANVWYRIILVVTDSKGVTDTATFDLLPKKSRITLLTQPAGLKLLLNDQPVTTSHSVEVVSGMLHSIGVISPQNYNDSVYEFDHWQHGGNASQTFPATDNEQVFTAFFKNTHAGVGLNEWAEESSSLTLYPNPNTGTFSFDVCMESFKGKMMSLNIFHSNGQLLYSTVPVLVSGCMNQTIDLSSDMEPGVYILQLRLGNITKTSRLVLIGDRR